MKTQPERVLFLPMKQLLAPFFNLHHTDAEYVDKSSISYQASVISGIFFCLSGLREADSLPSILLQKSRVQTDVVDLMRLVILSWVHTRMGWNNSWNPQNSTGKKESERMLLPPDNFTATSVGWNVDPLINEAHCVPPKPALLLNLWCNRHFYLTCPIFMSVTMIFNRLSLKQRQTQLAFKFELWSQQWILKVTQQEKGINRIPARQGRHF